MTHLFNGDLLWVPYVIIAAIVVRLALKACE